jgi:hypothetical protein
MSDLAWFTFIPISAELTLSSWTKKISSHIELTLDAYGHNILFINRKYAVCVANHWRLSKNQRRIQSVTLKISKDNELTHSENSEFVKHWKLENCVGSMYVHQDDTENDAGCELKVWIPPRNLRVLRQQLLNGKLPDFFHVSFRQTLAIGRLEHGIDPDGSDWALDFEHKDAIRVPICFVSFGYKIHAKTTEHSDNQD